MDNRMIFINNTNELAIGDVVLAIPNGDDIRRISENYRVRRAGVEAVTEDSNLVMYDLDNKERFMWDGNCDVTDDDNFIIVTIR
jgi:hypothetical protein